MKRTFFIFILFFVLSSPLFASEKIGIVEELKGICEALRTEGFIKLNVNDAVFEGDTLRTRANSLLKIKFNDGKYLILTEKTKVKVDIYSKNKEISAFRGGVRSIVEKALEKDESYRIKTTTAVAGIRGTDFAVILFGEEMGVYVFSGVVNLKNDFGEVNINKGFHSIVLMNQPPQPPVPTPIEQMNKILQLFSFNNQGNLNKIQQLESIIQDTGKKGFENPPVLPVQPNIPPTEQNPKTLQPPTHHRPPDYQPPVGGNY